MYAGNERDKGIQKNNNSNNDDKEEHIPTFLLHFRLKMITQYDDNIFFNLLISIWACMLSFHSTQTAHT